MKQLGLIVLAAMAAVAAATPAARADYAVLRSGLRLHITGYESAGDRVRLTVQGGIVDVAATEVVSIEPEDTFRPLLPTSTSAGPYSDLILCWLGGLAQRAQHGHQPIIFGSQ